MSYLMKQLHVFASTWARNITLKRASQFLPQQHAKHQLGRHRTRLA